MTQKLTPSQNAPNRGPNPGRWLYAWFTAARLSPLLYRPVSAATTIWSKASGIMKDVYTQILGISTIAAVVTAAVALLMINFGHTDRSTQEAQSWLKRIIMDDLAQGQAECKVEQPDQHKSSVRDRLAALSVPGQKSAGKPKREETR